MAAPPQQVISRPPPFSYPMDLSAPNITVGTTLTTMATHIEEGEIQQWPKHPPSFPFPAITIESDAGDEDAGREIFVTGVSVRLEDLLYKVTLDEDGLATIPTDTPDDFFDVYKLDDLTNDEAISGIGASGKITATLAPDIVLAEILPGQGTSHSTRLWIPRGRTGTINKLRISTDSILACADLWVFPAGQTWYQISSPIADGSGLPQAGSSYDVEYGSIISPGLIVPGPARMEIRAKATVSEANVTAEYSSVVALGSPTEAAERRPR